ncbi:26S proteasome subunit rpn9, partial [Operophtera brumata]
INPLTLVEIVSIIITQFEDKKEAIAFLEKIETKLNDLDSTEKIITELEGSLEDADGVTPVHARFYKLASEYYRVRGPMSRYYRCALRYVGMSDGGAALGAAERRRIAHALTLAALIAKDVYDLDELLAHPIMQSLAGTPDAWSVEALSAAAAGDITAYERIVTAANNPDLSRAHTAIRTKIALLCLIQVPSSDQCTIRTKIALLCLIQVPISDQCTIRTKIALLCLIQVPISDQTREARIPADEVELLVMKALAEKLVRGHID